MAQAVTTSVKASHRRIDAQPVARGGATMKRGLIVVSLVVVAIDLAALDDITTGREPGTVAEYAFLGASLLWFALAGRLWWRRRPADGRQSPPMPPRPV